MEEQEDDQGIPEGLVPEHDMNAILNIILRELEFLLDEKICEEIRNAESKEKLLLKMNVLRKVLAVQEPNEMKKLLFDIYTNTKKKSSSDPFSDQPQSGEERARGDYNGRPHQEPEGGNEGEEEEYIKDEEELEMERVVFAHEGSQGENELQRSGYRRT